MLIDNLSGIDMRNFFKNLLLYMLIIYFVLSILKGIDIPSSPLYLAATLAILSVGMFITSPILNFLTVRENFITNFLMTFLITFGLLYLLKIFMTDFYINEYTFEGLEIGSVVVNSFVMIPLVTIGVGAFITSFLTALFSALDRD